MLCRKSQNSVWTQSVPPVVAGGLMISSDIVFEWDGINHPLTAGGTDCAQAGSLTLKASLLIDQNEDTAAD